MTHRFKPGDRAVIVDCRNPMYNLGFYLYMQCVVLSELMTFPSRYGPFPGYKIVPAEFHADHSGEPFMVAHPVALRPYDPGSEPSTWGEGVWKPKAITTREKLEKLKALQTFRDQLVREKEWERLLRMNY